MYVCSDARSGEMTAFLNWAKHVDAWYSLGAKEQSATVSCSPHRKGPVPFFKNAERVRVGRGERKREGVQGGCLCASKRLAQATRQYVTPTNGIMDTTTTFSRGFTLGVLLQKENDKNRMKSSNIESNQTKQCQAVDRAV